MPNAGSQLTEDAEKKPAILDQQETQYTPVSTTPGQMCAGCMWYRGNYCHIVANWPENIEPTGWCKEYRVATPPPLNLESPLPVVLVDADTLALQEMALPTTRRGFVEMIADTFKSLQERAKAGLGDGVGHNPPSTPAKTVGSPSDAITAGKAFIAWKGKDGQYFWLARHTGKWVDREDEILADHAHDEFVQRVQSGAVPMPELWTWHKQGTAHGVADFVWKSGGFVCALGHFTGTLAQQERAAKYYNDHPDTKLSHMFKYPKNGKRGKVYHAYNTVEITTLPDGAEAFPYTTFEELTVMPFTKEQREMIRGIGGDEMVTRAESLDAKALSDSAKNDAAGIASKNVATHDNFEGSVIPGDNEEKALLAAAKDFDGRLKTVEALVDTVKAQDTTIKTLLNEIGTLKTQHTEAITRANALEQSLAEYQAVAPPASKSNDTIVNEREKGLLQQIAENSKTTEGLSLIEQALGKAAAAPTT